MTGSIDMGIDLPLIWAVIILFSVMMYVVMDGFDLGIGILFPFFGERTDRDVMMNTVAPVWDGNETWLVLGGAGLFAAFPTAYGIILSALYLPIMLMLIGLIFRGVAFEFRFKASDHRRHLWDKAFIGGSILAAFFQGVVLGAYINGFPIANGVFSGGSWDWFTPFSLFCGVGLIAAYALLGSTWLVMKTEGELQRKMRLITRSVALLVFAVVVVISIWTPLTHAAIAHRWFTLPNLFWFAPVPVLVCLVMWALQRQLRTQSDVMPFALSLAFIFLGYTGLGISVWPDIVPPDLSIWDAAAPPQSMGFALVGALAIIPVILMYTAWSYYVFRGKVRHGEGYH
jgi:cytochrome d ubiquinol oxidase subunit II